jgi:hypothetical protein
MPRKQRRAPPRPRSPENAKFAQQRGTDARRAAIVCALLAAAVAVAFLPALGLPFLRFDDDIYVWGEPHVRSGFTFQNWAWVWTQSHAANWHPLTTLSHILDCQIFGLHAWGHHLVNLVLHSLAAMLVFAVCARMTRRLWACAAVAAVFAVHPLRVESVVWVAERKDLLCGVFFWLTLAAYVRYARLPFSGLRYGIVVFCFALALLAKPMAVSLPLVMLVVDYWPLRRVGQGIATTAGPPHSRGIERREEIARGASGCGNGGPALAARSCPTLLLEKLPFLAMSALLCVKTLSVQRETVQLNAAVPLSARAVNALMSYQAYVLRTFWPAGLAGHYPFPRQTAPLSAVCGAAGLLLAITVLAVALRHKRPYLLAGWLWYLGMLVPVIGLVQVGRQSMADRYTYLPQIGLLWMIFFAANDLVVGWHNLSSRRRAWTPEKTRPSLRAAPSCLAALLLAALMIASWRQTTYWRDDFAFMRRALACNEDDPEMHNNMAAACLDANDPIAALPHAERAVELDPASAAGHANLAKILIKLGQFGRAVEHSRQSAEIAPATAEFRFIYGNALALDRRYREAVVQFQEAIRLRPDQTAYRNQLRRVLTALRSADDGRETPHRTEK